jgi:uncharacterized protein (UPF0218 family)
MLPETISQIEARITSARSLSETRRAELLKLIGQLKSEVTGLSRTHEEEAHSVAAFADVSTREAMRTSKNPELLQHSLDGLELSVTELEESHPKLVDVVNRIATALANVGI